jgi:hypothetical protein
MTPSCYLSSWVSSQQVIILGTQISQLWVNHDNNEGSYQKVWQVVKLLKEQNGCAYWLWKKEEYSTQCLLLQLKTVTLQDSLCSALFCGRCDFRNLKRFTNLTDHNAGWHQMASYLVQDCRQNLSKKIH